MSKPTALIILKSTTLDIYQKDIKEKEELTFLEGSLMHLELTDKPKFINSIEDFIKHLKPQTGTMLLSEEVVFQKVLDLTDEEEIDSKTEEFFEKIPFEKNKIDKKQVKTDTQLFLFSTNRELYQTVVEVFVSRGWEINIVAPASIFPTVVDKSSLTEDEVKEILDSEKVMEESNFIEGQEYIVENSITKEESSVVSRQSSDKDTDENEEENAREEKVTEPSQKKKPNIGKIVLIILILLLLGMIGVGAYMLRQSFGQNQVQSQQQVKEELVTPSPSPTPTTIARGNLSVQVLNGSGISGQAGSIKTGLSGIGFNNISTGNFTGDNVSDTVATFSVRVSDEDQSAATALLKGIFANVITSEASGSAQFDVSIVTGTDINP